MSLHCGEVVAKRGTFLYDGTVPCDIRIVRAPMRYGTGDHDDPPEVADDQDGEFFYVQYGSTVERGRFDAGGHGGATLEDAVRAAETASGTIQWIE